MAVDGLGSVRAADASTGSDSSDTISDEDMAKFEQAFEEAMPQAAMFMLQSVAQDGVQEITEAGDENSGQGGPF